MVNSALSFKLLDSVVYQAKIWGFICQCPELNSWQILPQQANQRWKLQHEKDKWILIVGEVPQLRLDAKEAITFLASQQLENN